MNIELTLIRWLDHFIPASIKKNHELTRHSLTRTRGMIAVLAISIILPLLVLIAYVALQIFTKNDFTHDIIVLIIVETTLVIQHIYFQSYGNLRITTTAYSLQYLFSITAIIMISGGWDHSPLLILLMASPLIAAMTISNRSALYHLGLVFIIISILVFIQIKQIPILDISHAENYHITKYISWCITLIFLVIFLIFNRYLSRENNQP